MPGIIPSYRPQLKMGSVKQDFYRYNIDAGAMCYGAAGQPMEYQNNGIPDDADVCTFSVWLRRSEMGTIQTVFCGNDTGVGADYDDISFNANDILEVNTNDAATTATVGSNRYRDPSSWYHFFFLFDSTEAANADRIKCWVNGVEQTMSGTFPAQNRDWEFQIQTSYQTLASKATSGQVYSQYFDGSLSQMVFLDGVLGSVTDFGMFTPGGVWIPKSHVGEVSSYGTRGWWLPENLTFNYGFDLSPNNHTFQDVSGGWSTRLDTPTNPYVLLNTRETNNWTDGTISWAGTAVQGGGATQDYAVGTHPIPGQGKWYFEVRALTNVANASTMFVGLVEQQGINEDASHNFIIYGANGEVNTGSGWGAYGDTWTDLDYVEVAVDMDNGNVNFYKNGVDQGAVGGGTVAGEFLPYLCLRADAATTGYQWNAGTQAWGNDPPLGYKGLNTTEFAKSYNYPSKILEPQKGFSAVKWTGQGAEEVIDTLEFPPDLVVAKSRDEGGVNYDGDFIVVDSERGATNILRWDTDEVEATEAQSIKSLDDFGFTLGTMDEVNYVGDSFVAWCWKKDPDYGFDIVTYTGDGNVSQTLNHNLGGVPEVMIVKCRDTAVNDWVMYHKDLMDSSTPETDYGNLNEAQAWQDDTVWADTAPTSTQFTVGLKTWTNTLGDLYVAYLFRSIPGYSKIFSYEGNTSANGYYLHCGFRPGFLLLKDGDQNRNWFLYDTARDRQNFLTNRVSPDTQDAETSSGEQIDFYSNGIKILTSTSGWNDNSTHFVIAIAEQPGLYGNAR